MRGPVFGREFGGVEGVGEVEAVAVMARVFVGFNLVG